MFSLFSRKANKQNLVDDLSTLAVDLHSHLIPGIDDGAANLEASIRLITELKNLGYKKIITTPHIMSDYFRNTPEIISNGLHTVKDELKRLNIEVEIEAAAEYYFDEQFLELLEAKKILTICNEYLLFELSYLSKPRGVMDVIYKIRQKGYQPLLAHPERYPYLSFNEYNEFRDAGCFFQLNILSLTGHYGNISKKIAEKLIDENMIDFIATDLHHIHHIEVIKESVLKEKYLERIINSDLLRNKTLL